MRRTQAAIRGTLGCAFVCALIGIASVARADDSVTAHALVDDAKALMAQNDYANACPKLEESQRLQPASGTLVTLGLCYEGAGKTATAWGRFNEAIAAAHREGRADRERVAREHLATLGPKLRKLTIMVGDAERATPGLVVKRDGAVVASAVFGTPLPVDPGIHTLSVSAPGRKPFERTIEATEAGVNVSVMIPSLVPLQSDEPSTAPAPAPVVVEPPKETSSTGSAQRTIAVVVGAVGVVGISVGTLFGLQAMSKKQESNDECPGGDTGPCSAKGVDLSKTARDEGNVSTVAFAVGGAAIIGAAVLWFTAPKSIGVSPSAGPNAGGVTLRGAF